MKNRQVIGTSQHELSKDKSCLITLPALCDEMTGSVNKGRGMLINKVVKRYWSQY